MNKNHDNDHHSPLIKLILLGTIMLTGLIIGQNVSPVAAQTNPLMPACDILPECGYIKLHISNDIPVATTVLGRTGSQKLIPVTGAKCIAHAGELISEPLYIGMGYSLINRSCGVQEMYIGVK